MFQTLRSNSATAMKHKTVCPSIGNSLKTMNAHTTHTYLNAAALTREARLFVFARCARVSLHTVKNWDADSSANTGDCSAHYQQRLRVHCRFALQRAAPACFLPAPSQRGAPARRGTLPSIPTHFHSALVPTTRRSRAPGGRADGGWRWAAGGGDSNGSHPSRLSCRHVAFASAFMTPPALTIKIGGRFGNCLRYAIFSI